jgi:hypothetical protein
MATGSMPLAQFHVQPDGVWLEIESPSGKRAAVNLREIGLASEVGEAFREWCDWHVGRIVAAES